MMVVIAVASSCSGTDAVELSGQELCELNTDERCRVAETVEAYTYAFFGEEACEGSPKSEAHVASINALAANAEGSLGEPEVVISEDGMMMWRVPVLNKGWDSHTPTIIQAVDNGWYFLTADKNCGTGG